MKEGWTSRDGPGGSQSNDQMMLPLPACKMPAIKFLVSGRLARAVEIAESFISDTARPRQRFRFCQTLTMKQQARGASQTC